MTCGKCIPQNLTPSDIIRIDFPKLTARMILEEGAVDEDTAD